MKYQKSTHSVLVAVGLIVVSGSAFAHWSSGPFLYNDAGSNPLGLANVNLASGVTNNGVGSGGTGLGTNTATGTSYGTYTQKRVVTSDYGWIQGQDPVLWANSHDMRGLAFSLANSSTVTFKISTLGTASSVVQSQATGGSATTFLSGIDWTPAFSIYKGLATQNSHEGGVGNTTLKDNLPGYANWSPYAAENPVTTDTITTYNNSPVATGIGTGAGSLAPVPGSYMGTAEDGTWGAFRSNADWTAGSDIDAAAKFSNGNSIGTDLTLGGQNVRVLDYLGQAQGADGSHTVTGTFTLGPGDYSIWVGGANAENATQQLANYQALLDAILVGDTVAENAASLAISDLRKNYGFTIETTVAAVPIPSAAWLFGSAVASFIGYGRKRKLNALT